MNIRITLVLTCLLVLVAKNMAAMTEEEGMQAVYKCVLLWICVTHYLFYHNGYMPYGA